MKSTVNFSILAVSLIFLSCNKSPEIGVMQFPEGVVQHKVIAASADWKPCPPNLPTPCEMIVLEGNPKAADMFSVRFKVGKGFVMSPHKHPKDERVTVISGVVSVAFEENGNFDNASHFQPGDYYVNARGAVHKVWADTTAVIQITGIGPWEAEFIEN